MSFEKFNLSRAAAVIYASLPSDGTPLGNMMMRGMCGMRQELYEGARDELLKAGLVVTGRGRGGSLRRVLPMPEAVSTGQ